MLINKRESTGLNYLNDSKAFVECLNEIDGIYKILKNTIQIKKEKYWLYLMKWLLKYLAIKNLI